MIKFSFWIWSGLLKDPQKLYFSNKDDTFEDLEKYDLPKVENWSIDIYKHIFDLVSGYVPLLEAGLQNVVIMNPWNAWKIEAPFICISPINDSTNSTWIRTSTVCFDIFWKTFEECQNLKYILNDLLNRRNLKWIRSILKNDLWVIRQAKSLYVRQMITFDFVYKDMKF